MCPSDCLRRTYVNPHLLLLLLLFAFIIRGKLPISANGDYCRDIFSAEEAEVAAVVTQSSAQPQMEGNGNLRYPLFHDKSSRR